MKNKALKHLQFPSSSLPQYHMIISQAYDFDFHGHKGYFEIDYLWEGHLVETINKREYSLSPGTLLLIRENDIHSLHGSNLKFSNMVFSNKLLTTTNYVKKLATQENVPHVIIPEKARPGFEASLNELFMKQNTPEGELLSCRFFYNVMLEWFISQEKTKHPGTPEWLRKAIAEMELVDITKWSVNKIVKSCCKSREHVSRTFQAVFGCSISQYLNGVRLEKARKLLIYTNIPISDICFDTGFNNINYFYRLFKISFGMTPMSYRQTYTHMGPNILHRS